MHILTGKDIRKADLATMSKEGISSYELMERAVAALSARISGLVPQGSSIVVFAGKGNNGGDGLGMVRHLQERYRFAVVSAAPGDMTPECRRNHDLLPSSVRKMSFQEYLESGTPQECGEYAIDALLGTGLEGPAREPYATLIARINAVYAGQRVYAVDLPSGLPSEPLRETGTSSPSLRETGAVIRACATLTIEFPKLSLLYPATGSCAGNIHVVPIGLDPDFIRENASGCFYTQRREADALLPPREKFGYKNQYGHLLVVAGSRGMMGAAVLCTGGALRSGCGLVTARVPAEERMAIQTVHPSAMLSLDPSSCLSGLPEDLSRYQAFVAGPGLGTAGKTVKAMERLLASGLPCVLDADALNMLARYPEMFRLLPGTCVLTPHVGELKRLLLSAASCGLVHGNGNWSDDVEKTALVQELSAALGAVIVVKGACTMVCLPDGQLHFNSTGNPGMAKGGSGDVLAGLVGGLMARGLSAPAAAVRGVWLHGRAGDLAAALCGQEAMDSMDILQELRHASAE